MLLDSAAFLKLVRLQHIQQNAEGGHEKKTAPGRLDHFLFVVAGLITAAPEYSGRWIFTFCTVAGLVKTGEVIASNDRGNLLMRRGTPLRSIRQQFSEGEHCEGRDDRGRRVGKA